MPLNVTTVLIYLGFQVDLDFVASLNSDTGDVDIEWLSATAQPTEQEINDTAASQAFLDWHDEHGNDPLKTLRRLAREALADNARSGAAVDRAIVIELLTYCRHLAQQHNDLLTWLGTQTTLVNRPELNDFAAVKPTNAEARTAIVARIDAGEADS